MASTYQHTADAIGGNAYSGVIRTADGKWIANAADNTDWADYKTWLQTAANITDPYLSPADGGAVITLQEGEVAVGAMLPSMPDAEWPAVPLAAPENVDVPSVMGTGAVGEELQCTWGNWNHEPTMYSGQWLRNNVTQIGVGEKYTVQASDVGYNITCVVTAENALGFVTAPPSNSVLAIEAGPPVTRAAPAAAAPAAAPRPPATTGSAAPPPHPASPPKK